jgi:hypothetical protein
MTIKEQNINVEALHEMIETLLNNHLPKFYWKVVQRNFVIGEEFYLKIVIACNDYKINDVEREYPQKIEFHCNGEYDLYLQQKFGSNGKHVILKNGNIKIPFRKPKKTHYSVLIAFKKFILAYKQTIYDNMPNLAYQEYVDYKSLF